MKIFIKSEILWWNTGENMFYEFFISVWQVFYVILEDVNCN